MIDFNPQKNIKFFDKLYYKFTKIGRIYSLIKTSFRCMRLFKNYRHVIFNFYKKNYPTLAIMRTGTEIEMKDEIQAMLVMNEVFQEYEVEDNFIIIHKKGFEGVKFWDWKKGTAFDVFMIESYSTLDVNGRDVLDIGSNIGDTAIYFLKTGARKIIGLEPSKENFSIFTKNIEQNGLNSKVVMLNSAIGNKDCIKSVTERADGCSYNIVESKDGKEMMFVTLGSLVKQFGLNNAALKLDCEGGEYDAILSTEKDVLRKFKEILIEYHYGYVNLKKKLESCGFKVDVSRPSFLMTPLFTNPNLVIGFLHAKLID